MTHFVVKRVNAHREEYSYLPNVNRIGKNRAIDFDVQFAQALTFWINAMSGIIGHTIYAMLGAKAAAARKLPIASIVARHWSSYLAGSYLGSEIQTMPEAICVDKGQEVGYGTVPLASSPVTGGEVRLWKFEFEGKQYRPTQIHEMFYGRSR